MAKLKPSHPYLHFTAFSLPVFLLIMLKGTEQTLDENGVP